MPRRIRVASHMCVAAAAFALVTGACGGDDSGDIPSTETPTTTSVAPASTATTAAPQTSTTTRPPPTTTSTTAAPTTTTTMPPPPAVAWGEPELLVQIGDTFFSGVGDLTAVSLQVIAPHEGGFALLAQADSIGFVHQLAGFTQSDHYVDAWAWVSLDGAAWDRVGGPRDLGGTDEIITAAVPFGGDLIAVGSLGRAGSNPRQVEGVWTFSTWEPDAAVWVGAGNPPQWERIDQEAFTGDIGESMTDVVVLDDRLVAVGLERHVPDFGSNEPRISNAAAWVSTDGRSWVRAEDPAGRFADTTFDAAVTDDSSVSAFGITQEGISETLGVWSSADGLDWTRVAVEGDVSSRDSLGIADAARSDLGTVVVGNEWETGARHVAIWHSPDTITWQRADLGTVAGELRSVTATPFGFVATGREDDSAAPLVLVSGDGISWYRDTSPALGIDGARRASGTAIHGADGTVVLTGRIEFADGGTAAAVWSGVVGPGVAPEAATDATADDIEIDEALASVEEAATLALSAAGESETRCVTAIEAITAEIGAGSTEASMETSLLLFECLTALGEAEEAAAATEELAAAIESAAPGSDQARAATDLAVQARAAADQASLAFEAMGEELGIVPES